MYRCFGRFLRRVRCVIMRSAAPVPVDHADQPQSACMLHRKWCWPPSHCLYVPDRFQNLTHFSLLHILHFSKFREEPSITFRVIVLTNRQTPDKTLPPPQCHIEQCKVSRPTGSEGLTLSAEWSGAKQPVRTTGGTSASVSLRTMLVGHRNSATNRYRELFLMHTHTLTGTLKMRDMKQRERKHRHQNVPKFRGGNCEKRKLWHNVAGGGKCEIWILGKAVDC